MPRDHDVYARKRLAAHSLDDSERNHATVCESGQPELTGPETQCCNPRAHSQLPLRAAAFWFFFKPIQGLIETDLFLLSAGCTHEH